MSRSNKPWLQILAEGTAIMLSILLAFGIEAWWAERGERLEEREVMHGLATEFSAYHERLIRDASRGEVAKDASTRRIARPTETTEPRRPNESGRHSGRPLSAS
ncbi:hypothetical protein ACFL5T_03470 [Gemmatimonadota bacterium]